MKIIKQIISCLLIIFVLASLILPNMSNATNTYTQSIRSGIEAFPESYKQYLRKIHDLHPNWTFDAYYTGISWDKLVEKETNCKHNRVIKTANSLWKHSCGNVESGYACASADITKYYMDPRNFINDDVKIFQFLEISFNADIHTVEGIQTTIASTFMNSDYRYVKDGVSMSYADIILEAARQSNMSPYSIATKIIQEVGSKGSESVSGTYPGYEGYYNFYNYGANDEGNAIANGLEYAKNKGWNNPYISIVEGAKLLSNSYTNAGQNTAYFYKWDVVGTKILKAGETQVVEENKLFGHQYMTNIQDPTSQAKSTYSTYVKNSILDEKLNFIIPVYDNMYTYSKLPTNLTTNDGDLYYMTGTDVRVRQSPSTSSTALATMTSLDEVVAVIERYSATDSSGRQWDKVKISSGIVGYIASQYLAPCGSSSDNNNVVKAQIINDTTIKSIPNISVQELVTSLKITNYEITKNGVIKTNEECAGTGAKLKDKTTNKEYTIISIGDLNGDGRITPADSTVVLRSYAGLNQISNEANLAGDTNKDGRITPADSTLILRAYAGLTSINL